MWLINCITLKLEQFVDSDIPKYAILSHTWEEEEVAFQDFKGLTPGDLEQPLLRTKGYRKIAATCRLALRRNLRYAWIDTCCINKESSAELTESINSMFRWYQVAAECYVFLSDLPSKTSAEEGLPRCKWFTRGWTLQELLAPKLLFFYDGSWSYIGSKADFSPIISSITNIHEEAFGGRKPWNFSVATRMSWAAHRKTTRTEDLAYCLMGIFQVNMPMIYGEGEKAFRRLQEEIVRRSNDLTIFAWDQEQGEVAHSGIFAQSPALFARSENIESVDQAWLDPVFSMTNKGLRFDNFKFLWKHLEIDDTVKGGESERTYSIPLGHRLNKSNKNWIALPLRKIGPDLFVRNGALLTASWERGSRVAVNFYLHAGSSYSNYFELLRRTEAVFFPKYQFQIQEVVPESHWDNAKSIFFSPLESFKIVLATLGTITVGASTIRVVVCIDFEPTPLRCRIFEANAQNRLSTWLFRHTRLGHDVTWEDVEADEPKLLEFTNQIEIFADRVKFRITVSTEKKIVPSISEYSIFCVNFRVETFSERTNERDRRF